LQTLQQKAGHALAAKVFGEGDINMIADQPGYFPLDLLNASHTAPF
jgi:hypothetical protein